MSLLSRSRRQQMAANQENGFSYDAVKNSSFRKAPTGLLRSEDAELRPIDRMRMLSGSRDITRNFAIARWMVQQHLNYVTRFRFRSRMKDEKLDLWLRRFMDGWVTRRGCDVAQRHPLRKIVRMLEARAIIDGDCFLLKTPDGKLQAIEGDRIRTPTGGLPSQYPISRITHGVLLDDVGGAEAYALCNRPRDTDYGSQGTTFTFDRMLPADAVIHHGKFDRFDQVRGITPLSAGLNSLRDSYDAFKFALVRQKAVQMMGLAIYKEDSQAISQAISKMADEGAEATDYSKLQLGDRFFSLQLDPGDKAEWLESKSPSVEFQNFTQWMISVTLKSIDIPYSFFNEAFTTYSGQRQALLQYQQSAAETKEDVRDIYMALSYFRLRIAEEMGELPPGLTADDFLYDWVPCGFPWIDPLKEVQAQTTALAHGITSRQRICDETGEDWFEIVDELSDEQEALALKGVVLGNGPDPELTKQLLSEKEEANASPQS